MGAPAYESPEDQNNSIFSKGSLQVLYGSENIPVHLNSVVSVTTEPKIEVYPNPVIHSFNVTASFNYTQHIKFILHDVLGRIVYSSERSADGGEQIFHFDIPALSPGTYILEIGGKENKFQKKISVIE